MTSLKPIKVQEGHLLLSGICFPEFIFRNLFPGFYFTSGNKQYTFAFSIGIGFDFWFTDS